MTEAAKNLTLPGQETSILVDRSTFKKDTNFVVALEAELENAEVEIGHQINFHTLAGEIKEWAGVGVVTHIMTCYLLDVPPFIMAKHQDPMFKNPMALYNHLQGRGNRLLTPVDKVICVGFRMIQQND